MEIHFRLNKFKIFLLYTMFQWHHTFGFWYSDTKVKDSISCYRAITLTFLQQLKEISPHYCGLEKNQSSFESKIQPRYFLVRITKGGYHSKLFEERMQQAETIIEKTISDFQHCLRTRCDTDFEKNTMEIIEVLRENSIDCGNPEYLSAPLEKLKRTCLVEENQQEKKVEKGSSFHHWKAMIHNLDPIY